MVFARNTWIPSGHERTKMKKLTYISNSIDGGPRLIDEAGNIVYSTDYAADCRTYCQERGIDTVEFDADGNGSVVNLPVEWIGGGERLENSLRVLALMQ
jgi:hypothetical protein